MWIIKNQRSHDTTFFYDSNRSLKKKKNSGNTSKVPQRAPSVETYKDPENVPAVEMHLKFPEKKNSIVESSLKVFKIVSEVKMYIRKVPEKAFSGNTPKVPEKLKTHLISCSGNASKYSGKSSCNGNTQSSWASKKVPAVETHKVPYSLVFKYKA